MWKCSKCAEEIGDEFEVCWACGTGADGSEDPDFFNDEDKVDSLEPLGEGPPIVRPDERLMTVSTYNLPVEAHAARIKLEAANIPAVLTDEFTVGMDWLLANAVGGIKLQVAESNYEAACKVLSVPSSVTNERNQAQADEARVHNDDEGDETEPKGDDEKEEYKF